jgi:DNA-binding MarR family transcriptional regulator
VSDRQHVVKALDGGLDAALAGFIADVIELAGRFRQVADDIARQEGQTRARWYTLSVFSGEPLTVSRAARRLGTTRQAVQRSTDELVRAGLLTAQPNPDHKTSPYMRLTPDGTAVLERITTRASESRKLWLTDTDTDTDTAADIATAHAAVRTILDALPD